MGLVDCGRQGSAFVAANVGAGAEFGFPMGDDVNHPVTTALGWALAAVVTVLNVVLIYLTVTG